MTPPIDGKHNYGNKIQLRVSESNISKITYVRMDIKFFSTQRIKYKLKTANMTEYDEKRFSLHKDMFMNVTKNWHFLSEEIF